MGQKMAHTGKRQRQCLHICCDWFCGVAVTGFVQLLLCLLDIGWVKLDEAYTKDGVH